MRSGFVEMWSTNFDAPSFLSHPKGERKRDPKPNQLLLCHQIMSCLMNPKDDDDREREPKDDDDRPALPVVVVITVGLKDWHLVRCRQSHSLM